SELSLSPVPIRASLGVTCRMHGGRLQSGFRYPPGGDEMHTFERASMVAVVAMTLCSGCTGSATPDEETAAAVEAATVRNGTFFNGIFFNGIFFNGVRLNPLPFAGVHLAGHDLTTASLRGAILTGTRSDGRPVSGSDFAGAQIDGTLSDGSSITLRIDAVAA